MFTQMQEEDLLISCGMTQIRKLSCISYCSIHGILTESSLNLSSRELELELEPTDQLPSQTLLLQRVAWVRESSWPRRATISYLRTVVICDRIWENPARSEFYEIVVGCIFDKFYPRANLPPSLGAIVRFALELERFVCDRTTHAYSASVYRKSIKCDRIWEKGPYRAKRDFLPFFKLPPFRGHRSPRLLTWFLGSLVLLLHRSNVRS